MQLLRRLIASRVVSTYLVSTPIIALYYTALIGDARNPPKLLASANFNGMAVIGRYLRSCIPVIVLIFLQMLIPTFPTVAVLSTMVCDM